MSQSQNTLSTMGKIESQKKEMSLEKRIDDFLNAFASDMDYPVSKWNGDLWMKASRSILGALIREMDEHKDTHGFGYEQFSKNRVSSNEIKKLRKSFHSGGARKKGKEFEPKASIRKICAKIESTKFDGVLEALKDAEICADWYESTRAPIGILITGVDDEKKTISYLPRGNLADKQKTIKFARLRGILTEINKKN